MQSNSRGRSSGIRYAYRVDEEDEQDRQPQQQQDVETSDAEPEAADPASSTPLTSSSSSTSSTSSWFDQVSSNIGSACLSALNNISSNPALSVGIAAGVAATCVAIGVLSSLTKGSKSKSRRADKGSQSKAAGAGSSNSSSKASKGSKAKSGSSKSSTLPPPGPNSKVKPSRSCVPLADGSAVVLLRPIAADNSCLFNAVGYTMHHSTNRAPFLRQVVSREVSSDPQEYSAAFLGMDNAAYCAWITNPAHWGGGIELAILAAHYRREIAAWNLASGACHVFGEERGYAKQVMVIYNGVHYDALAVAASPRGDQDDDVTEFNPRTKRGKMILAAAQQLVKLHRKGKPSHQEQQQQKQQAEAAAAASNTTPATNGAAKEAADRTAGSSSSSKAPAGADEPQQLQQQLLSCGECGVQLQGLEAAKAHAAATGHNEFAEVEEAAVAAAADVEATAAAVAG